MQINLGKGTLESLEQDLLPLAIGNPQRPIYRHLLVEIYGSMTFGLVQQVTHGTASEADQARQVLARIGGRAVKPLLDALTDPDVSQQRIAIDVLAYVQNRNAALPLFAFATGPAEPALRARAMIACGALADATLVPKYEALLFPRDALGDQSGAADAVAVAAAWGLARMGDPKALPLLRRVARAGSPAMRTLAVLGLGIAHDSASEAEIAEIARSVDAGTLTRAAAAYALGDLNAQADVPALLEIAEDGDMLPRRLALVALVKLARAPRPGASKAPDWLREAAQSMADAVFVGEADGGHQQGAADALAGSAVSALAALAALPPVADAGRRGPTAAESMPVSIGTLDVEALLDVLAKRELSGGDGAAALVRFAEPIQRAAVAALRASGARATAVLDALGGGEGELLPFVARGEKGAAADRARAIAAALEPNVVPLARNPDPAIRMKAIMLVARSADDAATDAVVAGLEDANEAVQRVALGAVGAPRADGQRAPAGERAVAAVGKILAGHESWAMRILAAQALGRLGASGGAVAREVTARLSGAATVDAYALVRQAALEALATFDPAGVRALAQRMAASDPEPRVREGRGERPGPLDSHPCAAPSSVWPRSRPWSRVATSPPSRPTVPMSTRAPSWARVRARRNEDGRPPLPDARHLAPRGHPRHDLDQGRDVPRHAAPPHPANLARPALDALVRRGPHQEPGVRVASTSARARTSSQSSRSCSRGTSRFDC